MKLSLGPNRLSPCAQVAGDASWRTPLRS